MSLGYKPRYAIGIDLGTSNCALAYVECAFPSNLQVLEIPQWEAPERLVKGTLLPSFLFLRPDGQAPLPGLWAREQAGAEPTRVVQSAKSWLCHGGVDRRAALLPWGVLPPEGVKKMSPVEASAAYLGWMRQAWEETIGRRGTEHAFDRQIVTVTVPASFDHIAQRLTLEAAQAAGFPIQTCLIEEPQAAFYDWLHLSEGNGLNRLPGALVAAQGQPLSVLVCDIGGGTTDFSLFRIAPGEKLPHEPEIHRIAVSDHILLGGDNIDLALAHLMESRLEPDGGHLPPAPWQQLVNQTRAIKEQVLGHASPLSEFHVSVALSGGSRLLGSTRSARLLASEVIGLVEEGFFPHCPASARPDLGASGLRELGLPYAADTAVSRHLADFLEGREVDAVLFNGGTMIPQSLRGRLLNLLASWQGSRPPVELQAGSFQMAVARGAAIHGVRRHLAMGKRILSGEAHAVYLEVHIGKSDQPAHLLCVLPQGAEQGVWHKASCPGLRVVLHQPVAFRPFTSTRRPQDRLGNVLQRARHAAQFLPLPPLETIVRRADVQTQARRSHPESLAIALEARVNELGLLQLRLVPESSPQKSSETWELEFNLRALPASGNSDEDATRSLPAFPPQALEAAEALLRSHFSTDLLRRLEDILGRKRGEWDSATLRQFWEPLYAGLSRRAFSPEYETAWLNAAGYFLRPGYGASLDPFRLDQLWDVSVLGLAHPGSKSVREQAHILWRRVCGGLDSQRQEILVDAVADLIASHSRQAAEAIKMAGALERLPHNRKLWLFRTLLAGLADNADSPKSEPCLWALGRLLNRTPLYAGPEHTAPVEWVEELFQLLAPLDWSSPHLRPLRSLLTLAARRTGQRSSDLPEKLRTQLLQRMQQAGFEEKWTAPIASFIPLASHDQSLMFGESLPAGLAVAS